MAIQAPGSFSWSTGRTEAENQALFNVWLAQYQAWAAEQQGLTGTSAAQELSTKDNAAELLRLQEQIKAQAELATGDRAAELSRLEKQIAAELAKQNDEQSFTASEATLDRNAELERMKKADEYARAMAALEQSGALDLAKKQQDWQTGENAATRSFQATESEAERAARLAEIGATGDQNKAIEALKQSGSMSLAQQQSASEMAQLEKQIASQQGIATSGQQAEMARLQAQIGSTEKLASQNQTFQATESAAERAARLAELTQTQSGAKDLAAEQARLQQETEQQRYLRALQQSSNATNQVNDWMTKLGLIDAGTGAMTSAYTTAQTGTGATDTEERAAEDAAFARAKEKIGLASRKAQDSLSQEMAQRGITGSGVEAQRLGGLTESGVGQVADTAREQALASLKRRYEVNDRNANLAATKRSQDIGLLSSLASMTKPTGTGVY